MSTLSSPGVVAKKLGALQRELETLGFALDSRGCREAADVALTASARIGELREDCEAGAGTQNGVRNEPAVSLN
jgi:hypothetical protein